MKTFDLMFGCLGNGVTVCDRSQLSGGDYKIVAHISEWGAVKIYDQRLINSPAMSRINQHADIARKTFHAEWLKMSYMHQYSRWYESMTLDQQLHSRAAYPKEKTAQWLYDQYIANMNHRHGYCK